MDPVGRIFEQVRGKGLKVVLPEGDDPGILAAARRLKDEGLAEPALIAEAGVATAAQAAGIALEGIETISPNQPDRTARFAQMIAARREKMSPKMAERLVVKPAYFAAAMLAAGEADAMVAGVSMPTRRVIEAGMMTVGLAPGVATPSSFFLMIMPDGVTFVFADCALNIEPTASELADIAVASARSRAAVLGDRPLTALLSFSTQGSGAHARVDKVREAVALARERAPDLNFDGELQADAALVASVAAKKGAGGDVAGSANVLVFPDLDSGNIAYKLVQRLAGAQAVGPFLQGFAKPICDLSRGASVDDIVAAAAISLAAADHG